MADQALIESLQRIADDLRDQRDVENSLMRRRKELMQQAHDSGMTYQAIGDLLGVTKAYVHQQIGKKRQQPTVVENNGHLHVTLGD